jgi:hypothetical protein
LLPARGRKLALGKLEYLVVLAQGWEAAYPNGTYPARMKRITYQDDGWAEADRKYAASLAPE